MTDDLDADSAAKLTPEALVRQLTCPTTFPSVKREFGDNISLLPASAKCEGLLCRTLSTMKFRGPRSTSGSAICGCFHGLDRRPQ